MRAAKLPRVRLDSDGAMHKLVLALQALPDPRTARKPLHLLTDIVAIALCAVIANCDSWEDFAAFGLERQSCFRSSSRCRTAFRRGTPSVASLLDSIRGRFRI